MVVCAERGMYEGYRNREKFRLDYARQAITKKCQISLYLNANIYPCVSDRMPTDVRSLVVILYELVDVPSVLSTPQIPKVIREVGCSLFCCSNVSNYSIGETSTYTSILLRAQRARCRAKSPR